MPPILGGRFAARKVVLKLREGAHDAKESLSAIWRRDAALVREKALRAEKEAVHLVSRAWHATKPKMVQLEHNVEHGVLALAHRLRSPAAA